MREKDWERLKSCPFLEGKQLSMDVPCSAGNMGEDLIGTE